MEGENKEKLQQKDVHRPTKELYQRITEDWWQSDALTAVGVLGEEFIFKGERVQAVKLIPRAKDSQYVADQYIKWLIPHSDKAPQWVALPADPRVLSGQCIYHIIMKSDGSFSQMVLGDKTLASKDFYLMVRKYGHVKIKARTILIFGMAGTGKTATKHLILGLPPASDRNSTPLAVSAEHVYIRTVRDVSNSKIHVDNDSWQQVDTNTLRDLFPGIVQSSEIEDSSPKHMFSSSDERRDAQEATEHEDAIFNKLWAIDAECRSLSSDLNVQEAPASASDKKWIYLIDSGGQPHFHNLLPLFVERISAAVYVLRLDKRLDDFPLIEYYKNGQVVGETFESAHSTADCFKYLVQSIQSRNDECKLYCIGTHLDKMNESSETIAEKNSHIKLLLPDKILQACYYNAMESGKDEFIIPINACVAGPERKSTTEKLREAILSCPPHEIKVPVWWYLLEVTLDRICSDLQCKVLSFSTCKDIARRLWFKGDALLEALKFFHKHHIYYYYSDILPNVVFCDTQVLLDKVTELIEHAAFLRSSRESGDGKWLPFRDRGVITIELLAQFRTHYVDGLFSPIELINIFEHLLIATVIPSAADKKEYYMPSLLNTNSTTEMRIKLLDSGLTPLMIQFKNGWPRCGVFCCLQVYLIKECGWSLGKLSSTTQPKQNVVKFSHPKAPCTVELIDSITFIEVYVSPNNALTPKIYTDIRCSILSGITCACERLHYEGDQVEFAFPCPHDNDNSVPYHPALVIWDSETSEWMRCTLCEEKCYQLSNDHKKWVAGSCRVSQGARRDSPSALSTLRKWSETLVDIMAENHDFFALKLLSANLISQDFFDEIIDKQNETKKKKGMKLFSTLARVVEANADRLTDFIKILRENEHQYREVIEALTK